MKGFIYQIVNKINGKRYIGSTTNAAKRKKEHFYNLSKNKHINIHLQRSYNKHGKESFVFEIIEEKVDNQDEIFALEQHYLDSAADTLFNIGKTAKGGDNISNHPNRGQIIQRISNSLKKMYENLPKETKMKWHSQPGIKNGMFNKTHTPEARKKISEKLQGMPSYRRGRTNEEIWGREKANQISRRMSEFGKTRTGAKNSFYQKTHSEKTLKILSKKTKTFFENMTPEERAKHNPQIRIVEIDNQTYFGVSEAARQLGVCPATIVHRIRSPNPKYINYKYNTVAQ